MNKALIIIDMLNGFCRSGYPLSLTNSTEELEKAISERIDLYKKSSYPIFFICDSHKLTDAEINNPYPPHCLENTEESEIVDSLVSYSFVNNTLKKSTLSIYYNTDLDPILKDNNIAELEIAGVCTDICIHYAAYESFIRGFKVSIHEKCTLPLNFELNSELLRLKQLLNIDIIK